MGTAILGDLESNRWPCNDGDHRLSRSTRGRNPLGQQKNSQTKRIFTSVLSWDGTGGYKYWLQRLQVHNAGKFHRDAARLRTAAHSGTHVRAAQSPREFRGHSRPILPPGLTVTRHACRKGAGGISVAVVRLNRNLHPRNSPLQLLADKITTRHAPHLPIRLSEQ